MVSNFRFQISLFTVTSNCPSSWSKLLNGKWYQISEDPMTFEKVNTFCLSLGGQIAEVASVDDYWSIKFHLGKSQWGRS